VGTTYSIIFSKVFVETVQPKYVTVLTYFILLGAAAPKKLKFESFKNLKPKNPINPKPNKLRETFKGLFKGGVHIARV